MDPGTATQTSASSANASMARATVPTDGVAMAAERRSAPTGHLVQAMATAKWGRKTSRALVT
jgi:hypothetical protein